MPVSGASADFYLLMKRNYVEAFREEGLGVGIYYSIIDWYHDDYPAYGDRQHPMRDNEA
jgi:alpha-L-fucosidase